MRTQLAVMRDMAKKGDSSPSAADNEEEKSSPKGPPTGPPSGPPKDAPMGMPMGMFPGITASSAPPQRTAGTPLEVQQNNAEQEYDTESGADVDTPVNDDDDEFSDEPPTPSVDIGGMIGQSMAATPMSDVEALQAENLSMRNALTNATSIINEMDTQPMPPIVGDGFVVPAHVVSDFVRIGRQLQRDGLCYATVGSISTLSLDEPNLVHITKEGSPLGQLDERHVASGRLGEMAPLDVGSAWKIHTILLAVTSLEHNGSAACAHLPAPYTTAMSLEQDLFVLRPSDLAGKQRFESVVIVDSDDVSEDDFLRQLSEGLAQSKCKAIVVRGGGVYAVGANFNEAWDNAAAIEHSMKILFLTRLADIE
ncbi:MAG TPA: hypothetical protein EYN58_03880 [Candidatus Poseidoniales archaeon]|nr:MAG: hypothetical protein CXX81_19710 [Euryarchaeota archaeon]PXY77945.1 MAG: hypothetical protein CXX81_10280 [Euryarchaeota archaeon]PXY78945.1 MAG: hypothetical protein CXX81_05000 [Euryarchaeota archaeon]HHZ74313.1 hypothetical protein [Candidatus Poseidoniales archaeon]